MPDDFEIITSNNTKLTEMTRPQLTSIDQPLYDIGAVAMRLLTKMMNKEEIEEKDRYAWLRYFEAWFNEIKPAFVSCLADM